MRAAIVGIILGIASLIGLTQAANAAGPAQKACSHPVMIMPRTFSIMPGTPQAAAYRAGFAEVASHSGGRVRFQELPYGSEVDTYVLPSATYSTGRTWVRMPCYGDTSSIIYSGTDVSADYWAAHEIMHTLAIADYIQDGADATGYINPGRCPSSGYVGVVSYCAVRSQWWGTDDAYTFYWWF